MVTVNGRRYALPKVPTVVICVDGCEPDYIAQAVSQEKMPTMKRWLADLARTEEGARWWLYRDASTNRWYLQGLWA